MNETTTRFSNRRFLSNKNENGMAIKKGGKTQATTRSTKRRALSNITNNLNTKQNANSKKPLQKKRSQPTQKRGKGDTKKKGTLGKRKAPRNEPQKSNKRMSLEPMVVEEEEYFSEEEELAISAKTDQMLFSPLKDHLKDIEDIDEDDEEDAQTAYQYVNQIYDYLAEKETKEGVNPKYMSKQLDLNIKMRAILVDWMIAVHLKFNLLPETLHLSVNLIDRYLDKKLIQRGELQLVSITAMLIASKYEEIYPPECNDFVYITDNAYTKEALLECEQNMLNVLGWNLTVATSLHFLRRFSKAGKSDWNSHNLSKYLIEIPLLDVKMLRFRPSEIAASAVYLSRKMLKKEPVWTNTLEFYTHYSETSLQDCVSAINDLLKSVPKSSLKSIIKKYSSSKFAAVAKIPVV